MVNTRKIVIIYDFDGTFYSGEHIFDNVKNKVDENKRKFLPFVTDEQYEEICTRFPLWKEKSSGADIVDLIYSIKTAYPNLNISTAAFWQWQQDDRYDIVLDNTKLVSPTFIEKICSLYPVYLVSNSSYSHLDYYLKKLGHNPNWFKKIISNKFEEFDRTKKHYYKSIMESENCAAEDILVFGDSDKNDLQPARILNMKTYLVCDATRLEQITFDAINKI